MDNISRNASLSRLDGNIEKACPLELQSDALGLAQLQRKIKDDMDKRKKMKEDEEILRKIKLNSTFVSMSAEGERVYSSSSISSSTTNKNKASYV